MRRSLPFEIKSDYDYDFALGTSSGEIFVRAEDMSFSFIPVIFTGV